MGIFFDPVPGVPCAATSDCCLLVLCSSVDGRPIKSVDQGETWTELDGSAIGDGSVPVSCGGGGEPTEPKPWYEANLGPLTAGVTVVNHNLGLSNPNEIVVQSWDAGGIEPLITNVQNRTPNSLEVVLVGDSVGDVHIVVARSDLN